MTIAILFTSANPLTNSHLSILKSAVNHLNADKCLFVAINGAYLKKKMIKRNDGFCLTEEERQEIIEKACKSESNLEFWGFEMGGATPKRYATLAKIQKLFHLCQNYFQIWKRNSQYPARPNISTTCMYY